MTRGQSADMSVVELGVDSTGADIQLSSAGESLTGLVKTEGLQIKASAVTVTRTEPFEFTLQFDMGAAIKVSF